MIRSINHVGIAVYADDVDYYVEKYESLGFRVFHYEYVKSQHTDIVMINCGNTWIELVSPRDSTSPLYRFLEKHGSGHLHHICFDVDSLDDVLVAGYDFVRPPVDGYHDTVIAFVHPADTGGVLWEFVETNWGTCKDMDNNTGGDV